MAANAAVYAFTCVQEPIVLSYSRRSPSLFVQLTPSMTPPMPTNSFLAEALVAIRTHDNY